MSYDLKSILSEAQKLQMESFGERIIGVNTSITYVNVVVFERDYDEKEDGDLKNFTFYDFQDDYECEAEWKRLMDYYNG